MKTQTSTRRAASCAVDHILEPGMGKGLQKDSLNLLWSVVCEYLYTTTNRGGAARFCTRIINGSRLLAIMYCVSRCVALEVLKYSPEETRNDVREHVEKCLSADASVGVTNSVYLRSIFVTERPEEVHIAKFRGCNLIPMCGFL